MRLHPSLSAGQIEIKLAAVSPVYRFRMASVEIVGVLHDILTKLRALPPCRRQCDGRGTAVSVLEVRHHLADEQRQ